MKYGKDQVLALIAESLNFQTFERVRNKFRSHKLYNIKENVINDIHYVAINEENHQEEIIIDKALFDYWWHGNESISNVISSPLYEIAGIVAEYIKAVAAEYKEIRLSYNVIRYHAAEIEDEIKVLKDTNIDKEYKKALDSFFSLLAKEIDEKNVETYELYQLSESVPDKLKCFMSQKQLSALLYLIWEAGLLDKTDRNGKSQFYNFCQTYFYYFNDTVKDYRPISDLAKKFSNIKTDQDNLKVMEKVFKELEKVYESI